MPDSSAPWYKQLSRYYWFVFSMASLAWLFDCLDQQIFLLARNDAMKHLLPPGSDPAMYGAYALVKRLGAGPGATVVPGHDPEVMARFPDVGGQTSGLAVRVG